MKIITQQQSDYAVIRVEGSLSNENLHELENRISEIMEQRKHIVIDIYEVSFICSAALGLLLEYNKKSQQEKLQFLICNPRDDIKKLFILTELYKHLPLFDSFAEAKSFLEHQVRKDI